jgi:hypothetical protein
MQTLGIVDLYWKGTYIDTKPGGTVNLGGVVNKAVIIGRKVARAQAMAVSEIDFKTVLKAGQTIMDAFGTDEGELQVKCDTGQTFVWDDAFRVDTLNITAGENGEVAVKFNGGTPVEL